MKITKALIPVAGLGTRLYPITKVIPKTMMPIGNIPVLQYIIQEGVDAGIKDFIIIINETQTIIEEYFSKTNIYPTNEHLSYLNKLMDEISIKFIYKKEQKGLADAILSAEKELINEDFVLMLGDDYIVSDNKDYGIKHLLKSYYKDKSYHIGIREVEVDETKNYGIVKIDSNNNLLDIIEKPKCTPLSNNAICGRYILKNTIFKYIKNHQTKGEILLTNVFKDILKEKKIKVVKIVDKCFDIGSVDGFIDANIYMKKKNKD